MKTTLDFNPHKYGFALHSTSPQLGLALSNFTNPSLCQTFALGRDLSSQLHLQILEFLQPYCWQDLAFISVAKGPGSFTSTRIGMVTARTLAQQLNIPLFVFSSLAAIAWLEADKHSQKPIAIEMPARRNQLFVGIYQASTDGLVQILPDTTTEAASWQNILNGLDSYKLIQTPANLGYTVTSLLELALLSWQQGNQPHWQSALPFYGQHPVSNC
ncbi:MAG: tRNA (adenosine(37)-N6)-threonylcarbamoyltransferase complex dimerization subunit type 1 TsaB [Spirulinaceae cyanobacterium]